MVNDHHHDPPAGPPSPHLNQFPDGLSGRGRGLPPNLPEATWEEAYDMTAIPLQLTARQWATIDATMDNAAHHAQDFFRGSRTRPHHP
jgi:hypothetical protein